MVVWEIVPYCFRMLSHAIHTLVPFGKWVYIIFVTLWFINLEQFSLNISNEKLSTNMIKYHVSHFRKENAKVTNFLQTVDIMGSYW